MGLTDYSASRFPDTLYKNAQFLDFKTKLRNKMFISTTGFIYNLKRPLTIIKGLEVKGRPQQTLLRLSTPR